MSETFNRRFSAEEMAEIRTNMRDELRLGRDLMAHLRHFLGRIPFAGDALAAWYCTRDPATPRRVRLTLLAALGYLVLPVDAIPDLLPIIGFTDDAAVIAAAIAAVAGAITVEHRRKADETLKSFRKTA
jgi:uncharacterized membrane protein YkvA (DUF1232 family)